MRVRARVRVRVRMTHMGGMHLWARVRARVRHSAKTQTKNSGLTLQPDRDPNKNRVLSIQADSLRLDMM